MQQYNNVTDGISRNYVFCTRTPIYRPNPSLANHVISVTLSAYEYQLCDPKNFGPSLQMRRNQNWRCPFVVKMVNTSSSSIRYRYQDWDGAKGINNPDEANWFRREVLNPEIVGRVGVMGPAGYIFSVEVAVDSQFVGTRTQIGIQRWHLHPDATDATYHWPNNHRSSVLTDRYIQTNLSNHSPNTALASCLQSFGNLRRNVRYIASPFAATECADITQMLISLLFFLTLTSFCLFHTQCYI